MLEHSVEDRVKAKTPEKIIVKPQENKIKRTKVKPTTRSIERQIKSPKSVELTSLEAKSTVKITPMKPAEEKCATIKNTRVGKNEDVENMTEEDAESGNHLSGLDDIFNINDPEKEKKEYQCPHCGEVYTDYLSAREHLRTLCRKQATKCCQMCAYKTRHTANLSQHMKIVHGAPESEEYICDQCGRVFDKKHAFVHHFRYECTNTKLLHCHLFN